MVTLSIIDVTIEDTLKEKILLKINVYRIPYYCTKMCAGTRPPFCCCPFVHMNGSLNVSTSQQFS